MSIPMLLHSENFELCRLCLLEPESNRDINFISIFKPNDGGIKMNQQIAELLGIKVEKDDIKPKIICENCHNKLMTWIELKKKAAESQIVVNYIATKKFGATIPGTSNASYSSPDSRKKESTRDSSSFTNSQSISKKSNMNRTDLIGCSSSSSSSVINNNDKQGNSSRSLITNHSRTENVDSESDDDTSCIEVRNPIEIIEVFSSDNEESVAKNLKNEFENEKLYYCSICQKKNILNHNCSQYTKSFFTCLVPNCNVLSKTKKDFASHYRKHICLSSTAVMCRRCYQEIKQTDRDVNGHCHIRCRTVNLFKCYGCSVTFNSMEEFAYHKLKSHSGRLMDSYGNYLCLYCESSFSDLTDMFKHSKQCLQNQANNVTEYGMKLKQPTENETKLLPIKKSPLMNVLERKKGNQKKIPRSSTHVLFTCLKPSCNLVFQNFNVFKFHHRQHFEVGNKLMCWQCCVPFSGLNGLRAHQVKGNCRTPGLFKCYECSEQFDDLQSLSIHKFTLHDGDLVANKKSSKTIMCAYCRVEIHVHNFKTHLIACQQKNDEKNSKIIPKSTYIKKYKGPPYKCTICNKVCLTAAALSSHIKIHNPSSQKKMVKKRMSNTSLKTEKHLELNNSSHNQETNTGINQSSTSQHNDTIESTNDNMANTNMDVDMNILSDNSLSNLKMESVNYNSSPNVNRLIKCLNCPRKFKSNSGLARHWQFCDQKNTLKSKPHNYYCTKCKKYYTRLTFFQHWRILHGKRLQYHKSRRFSCKQCPYKFMYKIALIMHNEHVHGEQNDTANFTSTLTPMDCVVRLPIISETTSLANNIFGTISLTHNISETTSSANNIFGTISLANNISETTSLANNISETTSLANNISETTSSANNIFGTTSLANNISETTSLANNISETTSLANNISETTSSANNISETTSSANNISETTSSANNISETTLANNISETTSLTNNISETTSLANNISETTLANNISETTSLANNISETTSLANNISETTSLAYNILGTSSLTNNIPETSSFANNIPETTTENNEEHNVQIKRERNPIILSSQMEVSGNRVKYNIVARNSGRGDRENETNINRFMEKLNRGETIEDLFYGGDTTAVNNSLSMNVSECTNNYTDKTITKTDNNETSISSVKEERQNSLGGELVAVNDTQNINQVNENKINISKQEFPTLSE